MAMEYNQCTALTLQGVRCRRKCTGLACRQHQIRRQPQPQPQHSQCIAQTTRKIQCQRKSCEGSVYCRWHLRMIANREQEEKNRVVPIRDPYPIRNPVPVPLVHEQKDESKCMAWSRPGQQCIRRKSQGSHYCNQHKEQYRFEKPDDCPICLNPMPYTDLPLPCAHWVCHHCVSKFMSPQCPFCRKEITVSREEYQSIQQNRRQFHHHQEEQELHQRQMEEEMAEVPPPPEIPLELLSRLRQLMYRMNELSHEDMGIGMY